MWVEWKGDADNARNRVKKRPWGTVHTEIVVDVVPVVDIRHGEQQRREEGEAKDAALEHPPAPAGLHHAAVEDEDVSADDDADVEKTVADVDVVGQEHHEAEVLQPQDLGDSQEDDRQSAVEDAERAVQDEKPV